MEDNIIGTVALTDFADIYKLFLSKITNYEFLYYTEEELEDCFIDYLRTALARFVQLEITPDYTTKTFDRELTHLEQDIITTFMITHWLSGYINSVSLLKQSLSSKDFSFYSQSQHLKQAIDLRNLTEKEATYWAGRYSLINMTRNGGF